MPDLPPPDPADHAEQFAVEWADRFEDHTRRRMRALGIPEELIGASDPTRGLKRYAFFLDERDAGSVGMTGRINLDSGVLNLDQLTAAYGEETGALWAKSRLQDRMDAIIVHEFEEDRAGTHEEALARASLTDRPISEATRRILRAMERGWKGRDR